MLNIGDKIKAIRKERGLTQKEFAKKINKSERMIQKYENSEVEPRIEVLREITKALDISFSELINPKNSSININESIDKFKNEYIDFIIDFEQLNNEGQNKVFTYTKDLSANPKYQKESNITPLPKREKQIWEEEGKEYLMPKASHDKEGDFTEEDYKHDDDLMNDEDLWK
ncbi:helix-turn-helix transcriptional regulator [Clostridium perfringens]|uniref:helix-turn-helix domain-containing protein n=1 Tax=Clostridium perfringens TaxID=1502 RepID=UPI002ED0337B|nr:helix-turn-helix transcriptional regulator [Clostridium perfringens]WVM60707.1 helix-turn-helix transcriptional regulator [Clostridium perfringens]